MPKTIKYREARLELAEFYIRCFHRSINGYLHEENVGSHATDMLLLCGVFVGMARGAPMNASQLSRYVGIPRATVIRMLNGYEEKGNVVIEDGKVVLTDLLKNPAMGVASAKANIRDLIQVAHRLSKMDI